MKTFGACVVSVILMLGSVKLKQDSLISELSLVVLLIAGVVVGLFIAYSDKVVELDLPKGRLILKEMKETEAAVKQLAKAVLELHEASAHHIMRASFDPEVQRLAVENLRKLTS